MAISWQKAIVASAVTVSLLLAACSSDQRYKRQINGNTAYLDAPALKELDAPAGMGLPLQYGDFDIPPEPQKGRIGKQLDIRPPVQPLAVLKGSRAEYSTDSSQLLVENSQKNRNLWSQVITVIQDKDLPIAHRQDANQSLTTGWVQWNRADGDTPFAGRYQVSIQPQGSQLALVVKSLGLQQQGHAVTHAPDIQRYNSMMFNTIVLGLDKIHHGHENSQVAQRKESELAVQSGSDDTGLPLLIVRTSYTTLWDRLPAALEKMGMKVGDRKRQQGAIAVTYQPLGSSGWRALGVADPELQAGRYTLQVGDLSNRSSLQFIDSQGRILTQSQNDALMPVFQAVLSQAHGK